MRKISLILFLVLVAINAMAYKPKDFDKYIDKLDVWESVKDSPNQYSTYFWIALMDGDKKLAQFKKDREKGKETVLNALDAINKAELIGFDYIHNLPTIHEANAYCDSLATWIGLKGLNDFNISVFVDDEPNAFCTPKGEIFISDSLCYIQDFDKARILGIAAHETAHYILAHSLIRAYETEKRLKKDKIAGAIIAGVNAAATGYAQSQGAYQTKEQADKAWESVNETTANLLDAAYKDAYGKFRYSYSREQEIHADLTAIRFLQWLGYSGQEYIDALKILGTEGDKYYSSKSDHPKMEFRIALLEYLLSDYVPKEQRNTKSKRTQNGDDIYD